ncbi:MAG: hypothetical protein MHPSP_004411 [Paramarteilia canceri]
MDETFKAAPNHFDQKIYSLGIKNRYTEDVELALQAKMILPLLFVPISHIDEGMNILEKILPNELLPLIDYFEDNYVGRMASIMWEGLLGFLQIVGICLIEF